MTMDEIDRIFGSVNGLAERMDRAVDRMHTKVDHSIADVHDRIDEIGKAVTDTAIDVAEIRAGMVTGDRADEIIQNHVDACDHSPPLLSPTQTKVLVGAVSTIAAAIGAYFGLSG
ncbi:MAG: hypothetical protein GY854_30225 [Deltaproteobacteria bacterium]|nr:hypothetical protein [Deltaproteobacteria bacterium]